MLAIAVLLTPTVWFVRRGGKDILEFILRKLVAWKKNNQDAEDIPSTYPSQGKREIGDIVDSKLGQAYSGSAGLGPGVAAGWSPAKK